MSHITVHGAKVRFRLDEGPRGAPVAVLLHMAGGGSSVWGPVASLLGRRMRVVAPDFPGHGRSEPSHPAAPPRDDPRISPRLLGFSDWTAALMDALDLPRALLVGHSMGGAVAMLTALRHPGRVTGLGLVCTSAQLRLPPGFLDAITSDYEAFQMRFTGAALPSTAGSPEGLRARPIFPQAARGEVLADFAAVDGFDVLDRLPGVRMPAVVVAGRDDRVTTALDAERLARALSARLVLLEGGHLLPRENARGVAEALATLV